MAASAGARALGSSMKSPRWLSSSSPMGVSSETGSCETFWISRMRSGRVGRDASGLPRLGHAAGDLLARRLAAVLLDQAAADADELVDRLDHVDRDADGAGLVGDGAGDGLADPPGGVGRELVALAVVELLDGADEADVAFLDQVEERHAAADVLLGDGDDEAQVGLGEALLGLGAVPLDGVEVVPELLFEGRDLLDEAVDRGHELVLAAGLFAHLGDEVGGEDVGDGRELDDREVRVVLGDLELVGDVLAEVEVHLAVDQPAELGVGEDFGVLHVLQLRRVGVAPAWRVHAGSSSPFSSSAGRAASFS